jgi:hypothetical protein
MQGKQSKESNSDYFEFFKNEESIHYIALLYHFYGDFMEGAEPQELHIGEMCKELKVHLKKTLEEHLRVVRKIYLDMLLQLLQNQLYLL